MTTDALVFRFSFDIVSLFFGGGGCKRISISICIIPKIKIKIFQLQVSQTSIAPSRYHSEMSMTRSLPLSF